MDMDAFAEKICASVKEKLGDGYRVTAKEVKKNNGVIMEGLLIFSPGQNMTPTIYLEGFRAAYESGESIETVTDRIVAVYRRDSWKTEDADMDFFLDYEKVKDGICYRLVGRKDNGELLEEIPHVDFLDLAICFYYDYRRNGIGEGTITIHNSHMEMWGASLDELFRLARDNTPRLFPWEYSTMDEVFRELLQEGGEVPPAPEGCMPEEIPMRVLSNTRRIQGAAAILYHGVLEEIAAREGGSFYIIPSSVHETIILLDNGKGSPEAFRRMIAEVNSTQVAPEEVLSDSLYYYDSVRKEVLMM